MRVQLASLPYTQNIKTFLTHFLISPIIQMFFYLLINQQYSGETNMTVLLASLLLSTSSFALGSMTQLLVMDASLGIFKEVTVHKPFSLKYWGDKFLAIFFCAAVLFIMNSMLLLMIGVDFAVMARAFMLLPYAIIFSAFLGIFSFILSAKMANDFFFANLFEAILPIVSGAAVSVELYPPLFKGFSRLFAYSYMTDFLYTGHFPFGILVIFMIIMITITVLLYKVIFRKK
ncbi:hypothetical protein EF384_08725 [Aerococcus agrisoli]|uniref:Uncharacterized protein n=1 Tax=Aerococcus agrisoli TaxID=2487350 RepID=A0A3N4G1I6_9LACT|nr:hypothetical protein [Aerococcus agrisoli]RPA56832.1 hypothetical protein EF384_08725 [Aerococcus agrisoli]